MASNDLPVVESLHVAHIGFFLDPLERTPADILREWWPLVDCAEMVAQTGITAPVNYAEQIYDASPGEILAEIKEASPQASTLLVIGHAPGIPSLATRLAGGR